MFKSILRLAFTCVLASGLAAVPMWGRIRQQPVDINVRWATEVVAQDRAAAERRFGLIDGSLVEGTTWHYRLTDHSSANIRALVSDSRVDDTQNLDRQAYAPIDVPWDLRSLALEAVTLGAAATLLASAGGTLVSRWRFWGVVAVAWGLLAARPDAAGPLPTRAMAAALLVALVTGITWGNTRVRAALRRALASTVGGAARVGSPAGLLWIVGVLSVAILLLTAKDQIYDAQHFLLGPATAILAGDRPYRDFFDTGTPLASYMAAGVQWLFGYRLLGEFVRQWIFIVAGVVLALHLGLRLSRSVPAVAAILPLVLLMLADMPTYHESKVFFFPLMVWAGWKYIERPDTRWAAVAALVTATGFLSRHDYGIYLGFGSVVAFGVARLAAPDARTLRAAATQCASYAIVLAVVILPWAVAVQKTEGLVEYVRSRSELNQPAPRDRYLALLSINPLRQLTPASPPTTPYTHVSFKWATGVDNASRERLEQQYGLRPIEWNDGRSHYDVRNPYDISLFELARHIEEPKGFDWERLADIRDRRPSREDATLWLMEMGLLVPLVLLTAALWNIWNARRRGSAVPDDAWLTLFAAIFLGVVEVGILRQPSYVEVVMPLAAALSAGFMVKGNRVRQAIAGVAIVLTTYAAFTKASRTTLLSDPRSSLDAVGKTMARLAHAPPEYDETLTYLRSCSKPGDHVFVTGNTPLHVSYYAQRPVAGGHIMWHWGWRSDPLHEAESLALLRRQSVPFAVSTSDPVLDDLARYSRIHAYVRENYIKINSAGGLLLVDRRRTPTRQYGPLKLPCFS